MTKLKYLCWTKFHSFRYHCFNLYLNNNQKNLEDLLNINMDFDSFKELMAIILVGRGDFSNFNKSWDAVDLFLSGINRTNETETIKLLLRFVLANHWNQNSHLNVSPPTRFNIDKQAPYLYKFLVVEGISKLKPIKFKT